MHSYSNLYETLLDKNLIATCFWEASKGKRKQRRVKEVLLNLQEHVDIVYDMLLNETFEPVPHEPKIINENSSKKTREIIRPNYAYEQIFHHLAMKVFSPIVERSLYHLSCANIKCRGIGYADRYVRKVFGKYKGKKLYILKMDIHHYYNSIDRSILKSKLRKLFKDDKYYNLLCKIIDYDGDANGIGIPLGYYSSQWFGNYYLLEFDYFVKQKLGAENYIRYADDMVIFGTNKKKLHKIREQITAYLRNKLHLELKSNWQVFRFEYYDKKDGKIKGRALDFLGYVYHYNRKTLRKSILFRARKKANKIKKVKKITWYSSTQMLSYMGWFKHADTYGYFKKYIYTIVKPQSLRKVVSKHNRKERKNESIKWCDIWPGTA